MKFDDIDDGKVANKVRADLQTGPAMPPPSPARHCVLTKKK